MRPWIPLALAFYTAVAFAQNNEITIPADGLNIVAGQVTTITWTDPSSSTVTIKLQQAPITSTSGYVLACTWKDHPSPSATKNLLTFLGHSAGISASAMTATFTIPATVNSHQYTI